MRGLIVGARAGRGCVCSWFGRFLFLLLVLEGRFVETTLVACVCACVCVSVFVL